MITVLPNGYLTILEAAEVLSRRSVRACRIFPS